MKRWWPIIGALVGGMIAFAIAWTLAGEDAQKLGDWRSGAERFIGFVSALGVGIGYIATRQLVGSPRYTRDGFTLAYASITPKPDGYREMTTARVADLVAALERVGYAPTVQACDDTGELAGAVDPQAPLSGANIAIRDPSVRGWIRVQLSQPIEGNPRSLGLIEMWSKRGESTEELALFTLQALAGLLEGVTAARESSVLSNDPAAILTAGLGDRPVHRK
jgi:hypothetical protein